MVLTFFLLPFCRPVADSAKGFEGDDVFANVQTAGRSFNYHFGINPFLNFSLVGVRYAHGLFSPAALMSSTINPKLVS